MRADRGRRAARGDADHAVDHTLPVFGRDARHLALGHRRDPTDLPAARIAVGRDQAWFPDLAAGGDDAGVVRQLQRRHREITLADAEVHGLAREPHLVRRPREGFRLPLARGQDAGLLPADVDAGPAAEAERRHERGDPIHAQHIGQAVEVDVAGARDGIIEIDGAMLLVVVFVEHV